MKTWKRVLLIFLVVLTILSLLLSACTPVDKSHGNANNPKDKDKNKDKANENDEDNDNDTNGGKVTICHRTGSATNPYVEIAISMNAAKHGHAKHTGDIIPAPEGGCPTAVIATVTPTIATITPTP